MNSNQIPNYTQFGFDPAKYHQLQKEAILDRMWAFSGRLYLEVGWKFFYDPHAARVLPGFDPQVKANIFKEFTSDMDVLFCINAKDIKSNRQLHSESKDYVDVITQMLWELSTFLSITPKVVINRIQDPQDPRLREVVKHLNNYGYPSYFRHEIQGYPDDIEMVLSDEWYGSDDHVPTDKKLVLVLWAASNSGKMSTCLGQIYLDSQRGVESGYAKYETFPIWNLDLEHPVNLAYEAATADGWDYNVIDAHHMKAYGKKSVNYNRDVDAFLIVKKISERLLPEDNFTRSYQSPTDMGINMAGFAITDSQVCARASIQEIHRRSGWHQEQLDRGEGEQIWIDRCQALLPRADKYMNNIFPEK